jgi:predicted nucleic acid-binding protein
MSSVLAAPEIADELEKKAVRHHTIERETLGHAAEIWESVSSRVESYDLTEQTIATVRQRHKVPLSPAYLPWINRAA